MCVGFIMLVFIDLFRKDYLELKSEKSKNAL